MYVSAIVLHKGEEPALGGNKGICNIFFNHCNLQCEYCQNFQISCNSSPLQHNKMSVQECHDKVVEILNDGCNVVGLVSPTPYVEQIIELVDMLHQHGHHPTIVYNTNSYDTVETIRKVHDIVDIYLPDYKYGSYDMAGQLSKADDYPDKALDAIKEMVRQKGTGLSFDDTGLAHSGVIVRHLVLPGRIENSKSALLNIAMEISNKLHISLMTQYYPTYHAGMYEDMDRKVTQKEYEEVVDFMYSLGFEHGWLQDPESSDFYKPDFNTGQVFQ